MSELNKTIVRAKINNKEYICDVAISDWERERGFMYREEISDNEGLLFIYCKPQESIQFWMKDTKVHLDIIFINSEFKVISVKEGKPDDLTIIEENNVNYVLEVPYGSGANKGDDVELISLAEFLEEYIDKQEDFLDDKSQSLMEDEIEDAINSAEIVIEILSSKNGKPQFNLKGDERIFSRKNTRVLIRQAKKAEKLKTDSAYKRLGKSLFKYIKQQDEREPEYVESK